MDVELFDFINLAQSRQSYNKDYIKRNADDIEVFTDNREKGFSII